jgi:hypothetical protein
LLLFNVLGARPALALRYQRSNCCAGFSLSRCVTLAPEPILKSVSLTHIRCGMLASLRATATIAHNMLDRLAIRRPHARKAYDVLTRSRRLAAASQSASRTATSPRFGIRPSKSMEVPDWPPSPRRISYCNFTQPNAILMPLRFAANATPALTPWSVMITPFSFLSCTPPPPPTNAPPTPTEE